MIRIRPAREADLDALADVWFQGQTLPEAGVTEQPLSLRDENRGRLARALDEGSWQVFAAEDEGAVVGLLAIMRSEACLNQLFVAKSRRSHGIGKTLIAHAKAEMPQGFWLRTRVENVRAQAFYAREGLQRTHVAPHPRWQEAVFAHFAWRFGRAGMLRIREAREDEFDAITDVWMRSWSSIGLGPHTVTFADLRARIPREIANGWSLFVATDAERIAGMLAINIADRHLDQIFVAPECQGLGIGKAMLSFARERVTDEMWLRAAVANTRAIAWYEREGFVKEREERRPEWSGPRAYYRWKRPA